MSEQLNKIHLIISMLAALAITIGFIVRMFTGYPSSLFNMALLVSATIVGFYFLGHIARYFLISRVFMIPSDEYEELEEFDEYENDMSDADTMLETNFVEDNLAAEDTEINSPLPMPDDSAFDDGLDDLFDDDIMLDDPMLEPVAIGE